MLAALPLRRVVRMSTLAALTANVSREHRINQLFVNPRWTGLHAAAKSNDVGLIKTLLASGAPIDAVHEESTLTPLDIAASMGHDQVVEALLVGGARFSQRRRPALLAAIEIGDHELLGELLQRGANPTAGLHAAASSDDALLAAALLATPGVNVNALQGGMEWTALHCAAAHGNDEVAEALLDAGASHDILDVEGKTALFYAVANHYESVTRLLLARGACPNLSDLPLHWAFEDKACSSRIVKALIRYGARLNGAGVPSVRGTGEVEILRKMELLDRLGANLDAALAHAAREGNVAIARFLLTYRPPGMNDALMEVLAVRHKTPQHYEMVLLLLGRGARHSLALHRALAACRDGFSHNVNIIERLLHGGADANARNGTGCTPLHAAVLHCSAEVLPEVVALLLKHGADAEALTETTKATPLQLLLERGGEDDFSRVQKLLQ